MLSFTSGQIQTHPSSWGSKCANHMDAIQKIIHQDEVQLGWTSIVAINVLILGIISTFLGLIGIYIFKIFKQVQGRPNAIIKKVYE